MADAEAEVVDLVNEGYGLAVRISALPDSSLVSRKLAATEMLMGASRRRHRPSARLHGVGRSGWWATGQGAAGVPVVRAGIFPLMRSGISLAIEYAARLICHIRDVADRLRRDGPFDAFYDVPFATAQTSTIAGGNAINTVPAECHFEFEFRNLPFMDPDAIFSGIERYARETLLPQMRAESDAARIEFTKLGSAPGLDAAEQAAITQLARTLTGNPGRARSPTEPKPGCLRLPASRVSCADRATSSRPIRPTSTCRWSNWCRASDSCGS